MFILRSQEGRCDSNSDDNILFEETRVGRLYQYKYLAVNRTMCIGVHDNCSHNLSLIRTSSNRTDGRCLFKKQRSKLSATKRPLFFIYSDLWEKIEINISDLDDTVIAPLKFQMYPHIKKQKKKHSKKVSVSTSTTLVCEKNGFKRSKKSSKKARMFKLV